MNRPRFWVAAIIIVLLAAGLRFHGLDQQSFWNDEGNSARLSERSLALIVEGTASDVHPPLYYLLLRGWRELAGETEFGLRSLSAVFGFGLVAVTMAWGRALFGRSGAIPALLGGALAALNPALIYYSQEARMYEMLAFLASLAGLLMVGQLRRAFAGRSWLSAYLLTSTAGLYTHYFYPVVLLADNLVAGVWLGGNLRRQELKEPRRFVERLARPWLLNMAGVFLLYLPWLPVALGQTGGRPSVRLPLDQYLRDAARWLAAGPTIEGDEAGLPLYGLGFLVLLGLIATSRKEPAPFMGRIQPVAGLAIPVISLWLVGAAEPPYYKFLLVAIAPMCLLAARGAWAAWQLWSEEKRSWIPRLAILIPAAAIITGSVRSLNNMYTDPIYARADYRDMAARIFAENHPNAAIVLNAANQWEVFTYYYDGPDPVVPLPAGYPDPEVIDRELSALVEDHGRIYLILWGEAERDPNRLVERWLDANAFKARDEWVGDVRFVTYAVAGQTGSQMANEVNLRFGSGINLLGYTIDSRPARPGDIVPITLFWQTDRSLDKRYKIFLHLVNDRGNIVAQRDSEPGGGLALTTIWEPGEIQIDNHGLFLPFGLEPGRYTLLIGLYDLGDPLSRQPIFTGEEIVDNWPLVSIEIDGG